MDWVCESRSESLRRGGAVWLSWSVGEGCGCYLLPKMGFLVLDFYEENIILMENGEAGKL